MGVQIKILEDKGLERMNQKKEEKSVHYNKINKKVGKPVK